MRPGVAPRDATTRRQRSVDARWRLAGLLALIYGLVNAMHPGPTGRSLAALLLTGAAGLGWTGWLVGRRLDHRALSVAGLTLLAVSGGAILVLSPVGLVVLALAGMSAGGFLETVPAAALTGSGPAAAAVAAAVTGHPLTVVVGAVSAALSGLALGLSRRAQLLRVEHAARLAVAEQRAEVEHERADVLAERNRIAREVHDVLAHTLSALSVQIAAVDSLLDDDPIDRTRLRTAVRRSRALAVDGLAETRQAVGLLREEPVELAQQLQALAADGDVAFSLAGTPRQLPAGAGLALLRITQEAVTNARKHAPGGAVTVALRFGERRTSVVVDNTAAGAGLVAPAVGGGHGLLGMRERLDLVGGTVTAGPTATGWRVRAEVPG